MAQTWWLLGALSVGQADWISVVLDSNQHPYVAYKDSGRGSKAVVMRARPLTNPLQWEAVGSANGFSPDQVDHLSFILGNDGQPVVAFAGPTGAIQVMRFSNGDWDTIGSKFSMGRVRYTGLAQDSNNLYVVFVDGGNRNRASMYRLDGGDGDDAEWEAVGSVGFTGPDVAYTSLALSLDGTPHLAYADSAQRAAVAVLSGEGQWESAGAPPILSGGPVAWTTLVLDSADRPLVAYQDLGSGGRATVQRLNGAYGWETVGGAGFSAGPIGRIALVVDGSGTPYVAFQAQGALAVMRYIGYWEPLVAPGIASASTQELGFAVRDSIYMVYQNDGGGSRAAAAQLSPVPLLPPAT